MKAIKASLVAAGIFLANPVLAQHNNSVGSELGHVAGGILVGGGTTAIADVYWPEHRVLVGFGVGLTYSVLGEALSGNGWSTVDFVSNVAGVTIGVLATDKWILKPVAKREKDGSISYGFVAERRF